MASSATAKSQRISRLADAFRDGTQLQRSWPGHPVMVIEELIRLYGGRVWRPGGFFGAPRDNTYIEILGVLAHSTGDPEVDAQELLRNWLLNAREHLKRHGREALQDA